MTNKRLQFLLFLIIPVMMMASLTDATAQRTTSNSSGSATVGNANGAYYDYSTMGELSMDVNIWGSVLRPGKYHVPQSIRLIELISLAGGPTERARLEEIRVLHDLTVDSTVKDPVTIFNFEEYQRTGDPHLNPYLYPSDTIIIPNNAFSAFMEILGVIRDVATVITSVIGLFLLVKANK